MKTRMGQYLSSHPFLALTVLLFSAMAALPVGLFLTFALVTVIILAVVFVFFEGKCNPLLHDNTQSAPDCTFWRHKHVISPCHVQCSCCLLGGWLCCACSPASPSSPSWFHPSVMFFISASLTSSTAITHIWQR